MRFVGGHVSITGGVTQSIDRSLNIGGNCQQIFAGSPRLWARKLFSDKETQDFNESVSQNKFGPTFIHALYLVNLASDKPDLLKKSIDSLVMDLKNGHLINSSGVIVHIGSHQGRGFDSVKDQIISSINTVLNQTKDTNFILENDAGQNGKIGSLFEMGYLINQLNSNRVKVCLDTAHLYESGYDLRSQSEIEKLIAELEKYQLLEKLVCIHLNDSATKLDSHRDMHANLGEGEIGLDGLKDFINHEKIKHLPLILEVPGDNRSGTDTKNIDIAKKISN